MGARNFLAVTSIVTLISLLGSFINFIAQAALALRFGAGLDVDGYAYALSLPVFLSSLIVTMISYIAAPVIAAQHNVSVRSEFPAQRLSGTVLTLAVAFAMFGLFANWIQPLLLPPSPALHQMDALNTLIRLAWILGGIQIAGALATTTLTATGRPIISALLAFPTNIVAVTAIMFAHGAGIEIAIAGMIVGAAISAVIGMWFARAVILPPRFPSKSNPNDRTLRQSGQRFFWSSLALSCFGSYVLVDAVLAARLGEGALATMGFAHRIIVGFGGLVVAGPSALIVPRLVRSVAAGDIVGFRRMLLGSMTFVGIGGLVLALAFVGFPEPIVRLLFERGEFSAEDARLLSTVLAAMAPGMVAMLFAVVALRALFCLPDTARAGGLLALGYTASYFVGSALLLGWGLEGIGMAYSVSWTLLAGALLVVVWNRSARLGVDQGRGGTQ